MLAETTANPIDRSAAGASRSAPIGVRSRLGSRAPIAAIAGVAGGLTVGGGLAPWLSFFAGLQPVRGVDGSYGLLIVVLGLVALVTAGAHLLRGAALTRWILGGLGFAIVAISGYLAVTLLAEFAILAADPLLVARIEPGLGVALLGGSLLGATLFARDDSLAEAAPDTARSASHLALAALLLVAGIIHLVLTPEHLAESTRLGVGFLVIGLVQTVLAPLLLMGPTRGIIAAALIVSVGSALALLSAVTVGLPFVGHGEIMGMIGPVEALDDLAGITLLAEVIATVLSFRLLRRRIA